MKSETLTESISFINRISKEKKSSKTQITFHGGEPLLVGNDFYNEAIPKIKETLGCETNISLQSNLWLLDDELCRLFKKHNIGIGTSLDGPQQINDNQRSAGYFKNTVAGIELLKKQGMSCGCIATFTKQSVEKLEEVFNFFIEKGLHFDVHAAIKPFVQAKDDVFLNPKEFGELLIQMLEMYLKNLTKLKIGTLDTLIKNVANKKSGLCTFTKCLGEYFAIAPNGDLFTCNRFVGNKDFCIGNIVDIHTFSDITKSAAYQKQKAWQNWIDKECGECLFKEFCHGGCPYAAFASGNGTFRKDPMCKAYKMIYNYIIDKGAAEFFSDEHMETIINSQNGKKEINFKSNPILYLMNDNPHPVDLVQTSKKIITAAFLGETSNPKLTTEKLFKMGIINSMEDKLPMIDSFYKELSQPAQGFNNLYLHITGNCNLKCTHCYSYNGNELNNSNLSSEIIIKLVKDAAELKFRKIIITGGEPILHPDFEMIIDKLQSLKNKTSLPNLVLRTNLASQINPTLVNKIKLLFDQIVVSIDGSEEIHDMQRGAGAYQRTLGNLKLFDTKTIEKKVSFACVLDQNNLSLHNIDKERKQVESLKTQFAVKDIRFLSLLPLGRAKPSKSTRIPVENLTVSEWIKRKYYFRTSCGLGQSIMIESNGNIYPCHVLKEIENQSIGNIYTLSLQKVSQNAYFKQLVKINVDTIHKCQNCEMRYLCGGVCKIWENQDCNDLFNRATYLYMDALQICNIIVDN